MRGAGALAPALLLGLVLSTSAAAAAPQLDWAVAVLPSGTEFDLEIAADPQTRRLGYMFREHVGEREGMLFIFDRVERHGIWMKNCKVGLDIVWLDDTFRVVEIAENRQPCPDDGPCPSAVPLRPARYVLEFAAGTVAREKLVAGDPVAILSEPPLH